MQTVAARKFIQQTKAVTQRGKDIEQMEKQSYLKLNYSCDDVQRKSATFTFPVTQFGFLTFF